MKSIYIISDFKKPDSSLNSITDSKLYIERFQKQMNLPEIMYFRKYILDIGFENQIGYLFTY